MKGKFAGLLVGCLIFLILVGQVENEPASAAPVLRVQVDQRGSFVIIGNTFAQECAVGTPAPVVGTVGGCGVNTTDSAADIFWRSDAPANGQATADSTITVAQARSTALLALPTGAQVTHAYLYWAATLAGPGSDTTATLERPGVGGFSTPITALGAITSANNSYRSVADVTALVQSFGSGAYRLSGVDIVNLVDLNNNNNFGAWWMVVLYRLDGEPLRNFAIYEGLDVVSNASPQNFTLSGFQVPPSSYAGRLGVVALEGDNAINGDSLAFNGAQLSNAQNPANNFFNSTRSNLGNAVSVTGDLPQLTGTAQSMSGIDLDILDLTPRLTPGQTSVSITASSTGDVYFLATLVTEIATLSPSMNDSTKSAIDLNGGQVLPGDAIQYTLVITNTGNDNALQVVLNDPLPSGVTYKPGSMVIASGENAGAKTDAPGDDQAEYEDATRSVVMRLGSGANATQGGTLAFGAVTVVQFQATVNADCQGPRDIANQGTINTRGELGNAQHNYLTDGDTAAPGSQPTMISVNFRCLNIGLAGSGSGKVTSIPAGIDCGLDCGEVVVDGTVIILTAVPTAASSIFAGWGGSVTGMANPISVKVDANQWITATFAAYTLYLPIIHK